MPAPTDPLDPTDPASTDAAPTRGTNLQRGITTITTYLRTLPDRPGVYRMLGADDAVLYVGKAKALKKRVTAYTQPDRLPLRLQRMVSLTHRMEFIETHTEAEALLLEINLIKNLDPTYNILLKDDKAYPYIFIPADHQFPNIMKHRGARTRPGEYYGPFLSGQAVSETMNVMHRVFQLRNCTDSYFAARTRPCLQYHIKRCTAPCVNRVTQEVYAEQVQGARDFLDGRSTALQQRYAEQMQAAAAEQDYETAGLYRDKIKMLTTIQARQDINLDTVAHADVIALARDASGAVAIQVFFFRHGQNYGNLAFFPRHTEDEADTAVLASFMGQFYADKPVPPEIIVSHMPDDALLLESVFTDRAGRRVSLIHPQRGDRTRILDFARRNATEALARHQAARTAHSALQESMQRLFDLDAPVNRIEVYDNSHLGGTQMVGAMIVAGPEGFRKNAYRKFNIRDAGAADDYAMMREVMTRRFAHRDTDGPGTPNWPDLLLIDGGPGQLHAVTDVLTECGVIDDVTIVAISKGPDRNAGREVLHQTGKAPRQLPPNDPVLHYLQRLRDEAHRFAIGSQRQRRQKNINRSALDEIPGIGAKRKRALLLHFGSARAVADAGLSDLDKVEGISKAFAQKIYSYFHNTSNE